MFKYDITDKNFHLLSHGITAFIRLEWDERVFLPDNPLTGFNITVCKDDYTISPSTPHACYFLKLST